MTTDPVVDDPLVADLPSPRAAIPGADAMLAALPSPLLLLDSHDAIRFVNAAGEQFMRTSSPMLVGRPLAAFIPEDNPVFALVAQARETGAVINEYGLSIESPRVGSHEVDVTVVPMIEHTGTVMAVLRQRSMARRMDHQAASRAAWRSVTGMAAVLAHEVKNPLSGIRGAAQLLEANSDQKDRELTALIRDETDRICNLVDEMQVFSDKPLRREAVNIHHVLDHVRKVAETGFAAHVRFQVRFDPSLPPVLGNRDQLIQVFLNLVKNATEACAPNGGVVTLATAFRHGVRLSLPGTNDRVELPLEVVVEDNGGGIPAHIQADLFEPFVSGKQAGTGLGLALVAKILGDHGAVIDYDSEPGKTSFRVRLPMTRPVAKGTHAEAEGQPGDRQTMDVT